MSPSTTLPGRRRPSYLINPTDRPELIVLANIHIDVLERRIRFICAGGASHAGFTHEPCYDRIIAGTAPLDRNLVPGPDQFPFSVNKRTVGIEVDGAGGPDEWDDWAYRAAVATSAACQVVADWPVGDAPRVGAHKEHTTRKPTDPEANMGKFRMDVLDCIANPWGPNAGRPDFVLGDRVLSRNGNDKGPDVADLIRLLNALGFALVPGDEFGPAVEGAVMDFQSTHGLTPDVIVRLDTVEAMKRALTLPAASDIETPPPVAGQGRSEAPQAPPSVHERKFRFGQANLEAERFGGINDDSSRRGEFLRDKMDCSIYALSEVSEKARNAIRAVLGEDRYRVFPIGFVWVLWDSEKWQHAGKKSVDFGTPIHGAIRVTLEDLRGSGLTMDVISMHVRPKVIADLAGQQADIKKAMKALRRPGVPTLVAGDFNTGTAFDIIEPFGFVRSTESINTVNDPGMQRLDAVFFTPDVQFREANQVDPGTVSCRARKRSRVRPVMKPASSSNTSPTRLSLRRGANELLVTVTQRLGLRCRFGVTGIVEPATGLLGMLMLSNEGVDMARISVIGGTGYAGSAVVREAAKRGHEVTALSRTSPEVPVPGVTYVAGSVLDPDVLQGAVDGADVVFEALSPRGDMAGKVEAVIDDLIGLTDRAGVRLGVLGGVSSVLVSPDGPRLFDVSDPAPEVLPEIQLGLDKLEAMKAAPDSLDWFYVSPAAEFGAWVPSTETGHYRISDDVLLKGPDGKSEISAGDLAIAVVDELENPIHHRQRFHVAH